MIDKIETFINGIQNPYLASFAATFISLLFLTIGGAIFLAISIGMVLLTNPAVVCFAIAFFLTWLMMHYIRGIK